MKGGDLKIMQPSKPKELYPKLYGIVMYICEITEKQRSRKTSTPTGSWLCAKHNFLPDYIEYEKLTTSDVEETVLRNFLGCTRTFSFCSSANSQKEKTVCFG